MRGARLVVCMLLFPAYLALVGCSDGTSVADGVGKAAGQLANVRTTVAQQGTSGGFVDVNGDGIDDLVVCAPYATQGETLVWPLSITERPTAFPPSRSWSSPGVTTSALPLPH